MAGKILYVSPEAPVGEAARSADQRAIGASGLRLGVLDNSKGNADHLLAFLIEGVRAALPVASVVTRRKPASSRPADAQALDELATQADCVVSAMGIFRASGCRRDHSGYPAR